MKNLCTICMRGGSKGVSHKNLRELHGKPLMAYTIERALETALFDHVVVSTDSEKIAETARTYGAEAWFLRHADLATDEAAKLPAIRHVFQESEKHYGHHFDVLMDMDATSPLRKVEDIIEAYQQFINEDADILITACPARKNPYFNMVERANGRIQLEAKALTMGEIHFTVQDGKGGSPRGSIEVLAPDPAASHNERAFENADASFEYELEPVMLRF